MCAFEKDIDFALQAAHDMGDALAGGGFVNEIVKRGSPHTGHFITSSGLLIVAGSCI